MHKNLNIRRGAKLMKGALSVLLALLAIAFLANSIALADNVTESVYKLYIDGTASVTLFIKVPLNADAVNVSIEPGYIDGSALALTPEGTPLYVDIAGSIARIEVYNLTSKIIFTYNAFLGNVSGNTIVVDTIHLGSKGLVILPKEAALVNASGNPQVSLSNGSISLIYSSPGTYKVVFAVLPPSSGTSSQTNVGGGTSPKISNTGVEFGGGFTQLLLWVLGALVVLGSIILYLFVRKHKKIVGGEFSVETGLDERDLMILSALQEGEKSVSELSRFLGLNKSVVWRRVKRLRSMGLLNMKVEKGKTIYGLTELGAKALKKD